MKNRLTNSRWLNCIRGAALSLLIFTQIPASIAADVTLAWNAVINSSVDHYLVAWGNNSGSYTGNTKSTATQATVSGLTSGQSYYYAVKACDASGTVCSGYSNEVKYTVGASVPVVPAPSAQFSVSTYTGKAPLSVTFSNSSTGEITTYAWNFGDGSTSSAKSPVHTYSATGSYTVSLTATGPGGTNKKVLSTPIEVTPAAPVAVMAANITSGVAPLTVQFANNSTGVATTYSWNFGDNTTSTATSPAHTYTQPGTYSVSLTATGPGGSSVASKGSYITVLNTALDAQFTADVLKGPAPLAVRFASASRGTINTFNWSFGDGQSGTGSNPSHTYQKPGTYSVSLTVTGPDGNDIETKSGFINVTDSTVGLKLEAGETQVNNNWKTITLEKTFTKPIVIASSLSFSGVHPAVIQVKGVNSKSFSIRVREWSNTDPAHVMESVGYLVVEQGRHQLPDGKWLEAGAVAIDSSTPSYPVNFSEAFSAVPVVIATIASDNDVTNTAVASRLKYINTYSFAVGLQKEEGQPQIHAKETVNYLAWQPSSGEVNGYAYQAGRTPASVTDNFYKLAFPTSFAQAPVFLADMQTINEADTANIRWQEKTNAYVTVQVDEETSADKEVLHSAEVVGFLALNKTAASPSSPVACASPCSLLEATATPSVLSDPDSASVELGMQFRSEVEGWVTGVRFYKGPQNTGTHLGSLWSSGGQLLAQATFMNETGSGWQQVNFASAVKIAANTVYVVSYHTQVGRYSVNGGFFNSPLIKGPLRGLSSAENGGNGRYRYGSGGFPNSTYNGNNYWVDVVFKTTN